MHICLYIIYLSLSTTVANNTVRYNIMYSCSFIEAIVSFYFFFMALRAIITVNVVLFLRLLGHFIDEVMEGIT